MRNSNHEISQGSLRVRLIDGAGMSTAPRDLQASVLGISNLWQTAGVATLQDLLKRYPHVHCYTCENLKHIEALYMATSDSSNCGQQQALQMLIPRLLPSIIEWRWRSLLPCCETLKALADDTCPRNNPGSKLFHGLGTT